MSPLTCALLLVFTTLGIVSWSARTAVPRHVVVLNWFILPTIVVLVFVVGNRVVAARYANRPVPGSLVVAMAAALLLAAVAPLFIESVIGLEGLRPEFVVQHVVPSRLPMPAYYLLAVYVVGLRQWYASARASALSDLVQLRAANLVASGALTATLAGAVEDARSMSSGSRAAADEMLAHAMTSSDPGASSQAARAVRNAARNAVRTSSHQMWDDGPVVHDSIPWRDMLLVSLRAHPLPLVAAALLAAYGCLLAASRLGGVRPPGGVATALIAVACLAVVFMAGRAAIRWRPALAPVITLMAVVLAVAGVPRIPGVVDPAIANAFVGAAAVTAALQLLMVVVGTSLLLTARDSAAAVVAGLYEARREAEVDRRVLGEATARVQRDVAQHVHGTVQPGLIAASLAIDEAVYSEDHAALARALASARTALDADFTPQPATAGMSLAQVADALRTQWAGLLDVQYDGALPTLAPGPTEAFKDVVQECLNNAYIHGGARHAVVRVGTEADGRALVHISDDCSGPGSGPPGLGSAIMTNATHGEWSMKPADDGGSVVRAVIR